LEIKYWYNVVAGSAWAENGGTTMSTEKGLNKVVVNVLERQR